MRVALVLGAGGARGYAHLGVLDVLHERDHQIATIAGTSMGALVGALAAAGRADDFAAWARTLTQRKVLRLMDPAFAQPGAIRANKVLVTVGGMLGDQLIEDLPIPYTAVAADLTSQREVWFQSGPVTAAIRASIAIPGAITPVQMGDRLLVDGGILNPVPVEPTLGVTADFTLAVNLSGHSPTAGSAPVPEHAEVPAGQDWLTWLGKVGLGSRAPRSRGAADSAHDDLSAADVMLRSFETVQNAMSRYRMATNLPDVLVSVPLRSARTTDFHRAAELIDLGRQLATDALDEAGY